jgi:hypothetical protein
METCFASARPDAETSLLPKVTLPRSIDGGLELAFDSRTKAQLVCSPNRDHKRQLMAI